MAVNMEQEYKQLQEHLKSAGETAQKIQAELRKDKEFGSIYLNRSKLDVLEKIAGFSTENGKLLDSVKPEIDKLRLQSQHKELKKKKKLAETSGAIIADLMAKMGYEVHGCDAIESYSKEQMNLKTFAVNKQMFDKLFPVSPYSVSSAKKAKEETADEAKTPTSEGYREYYLLHKEIAQCPFDSNQLVYKLVQVENKKGQSKKLNFQICQACNRMFILKKIIYKPDEYKLTQRELPIAAVSAQKTARQSLNKNNKSTRNYKVGSIVTLGTYPQTEAGTDRTPIEWLVLAREGDKALLISKYALDCMKYNTEKTDISWVTCSLRRWLNNEFYNRAFNSMEKVTIVDSKVSAEMNPEANTDTGNNTMDKVFLLGVVEIEKYFKDDASRKCAPTDYAKRNGAWTSSTHMVDGRASCWWWLCSPGYCSDFAVLVYYDGTANYYGNRVDSGSNGVRPCVWVRLF